jgi:hypothetical protein
MGGVVSRAAIALGLAAGLVGGSASAETVTVAISNKTPALGNILITTGPAQAKVAASSGVVTFSGGTAFRVKTNGASPANIPVSTVTVTCTNSTGNCKATYHVYISAVSATGKATSVPLVNIGPPTCSSGLTCTVTLSEKAPSDTVAFFDIVSTNNQGYTATFTLGAGVNLNAATTANSGAAQWQYKVRVSTGP